MHLLSIHYAKMIYIYMYIYTWVCFCLSCLCKFQCLGPLNTHHLQRNLWPINFKGSFFTPDFNKCWEGFNYRWSCLLKAVCIRLFEIKEMSLFIGTVFINYDSSCLAAQWGRKKKKNKRHVRFFVSTEEKGSRQGTHRKDWTVH